MSEIQDAFTELLYGVGAPLGLLLIVSIMLLVSSVDKRAGALFVPFSIILGLSYFNNVSSSSNFMWFGFFMFGTTIFMIVRLMKNK